MTAPDGRAVRVPPRCRAVPDGACDGGHVLVVSTFANENADEHRRGLLVGQHGHLGHDRTSVRMSDRADTEGA
ncbi:hypothetical protein KPATCC21470_7576 [Kitasatospora purpeofusca]